MSDGGLRVLIEEMYGQIRVVAEGVTGNNERLDWLKSELEQTRDELHRRIDVLRADMKKGFDTVDGRLGAVEGRLGAVEGRLGAVEGRLEVVEGRLDGVESGLGGLREDVRGLRQQDRRLAKLEARVTRLAHRPPRPGREG